MDLLTFFAFCEAMGNALGQVARLFVYFLLVYATLGVLGLLAVLICAMVDTAEWVSARVHKDARQRARSPRSA